MAIALDYYSVEGLCAMDYRRCLRPPSQAAAPSMQAPGEAGARPFLLTSSDGGCGLDSAFLSL